MIKVHIACISVFTLIFYYRNTNITQDIAKTNDPKYRLLEPYNATQLQTKDEYNKLIDLNTFSFITNHTPCKKYPEGLLLVVIVSSNPVNFRNRMTIRNTWGKTVNSTVVVFLLGDPQNDTISLEVHNENMAYNDIVQGDFKDAYRNLTYKHVMGFKWVAHHCPMAKYVLKTDDDVVVHSREMRRYLARELSPWGAQGLIACPVWHNARAQRHIGLKWKVSYTEWPHEYYPTYCAGWAVIYSTDVVIRLLEAAQETPYFWIDDVYTTGILAQKLGIERTSIHNLILPDIMRSSGSKYNKTFLLGPRDLSVDQMLSIWNSISD